MSEVGDIVIRSFRKPSLALGFDFGNVLRSVTQRFGAIQRPDQDRRADRPPHRRNWRYGF